MRILVIEDDANIAEVVKLGLERAHFAVDVARDGATGLQFATLGEYALVVLDLMLPEMDGWTVCEQLRERRKTVPVLMLTARDTVADRVRGLEIGADDYLCKPFEFPELLARVQALLRRDKVNRGRTIRISDLEIDTKRQRVSRGGHELMLTPREYALLEALARSEGQTLTREIVQEAVWSGEFVYPNTVDAHIKGLRKKIDADHEVRLIHTVYGMGYTLRRPSEGDET